METPRLNLRIYNSIVAEIKKQWTADENIDNEYRAMEWIAQRIYERFSVNVHSTPPPTESKTETDLKAHQPGLLEAAGKLYTTLQAIPCNCAAAYTNRKMSDPNCPRCNWVIESELNEFQSLLTLSGKETKCDK